jgi:NAD(P)-dependent dehydrogenase (short-subunit alcohol dehydrogenase family)
VAADMRFDGRTVVVTGAGRGLGLGYASLLASLGASVVVNDLGGRPDGNGADSSVSEAAAQDLRDLGGAAVADTSDVSSEAGANRLVAAALDAFGRLDAVINNAGFLAGRTFPDVSLDDLRQHLDVNLVGTFLVTRAAWPHLVASGHGRVVTTISSAVYGAAPVLPYATAKGAVLGMTKALAQAGKEHGVTVNAFAPRADTRLTGDPDIRRAAGVSAASTGPARTPNRPAAAAAFLVHDSCDVTGRVVVSDGGRVAEMFLGETRGTLLPDGDVGAVAAAWDRIVDRTGFAAPTSAAEQRTHSDAVLGAPPSTPPEKGAA